MFVKGIILWNEENRFEINFLFDSKICWGGKVPEELYTDKNDSLTKNDDFVDTTVKKGGKIKLDLNCEDTDYLLK